MANSDPQTVPNSQFISAVWNVFKTLFCFLLSAAQTAVKAELLQELKCSSCDVWILCSSEVNLNYLGALFLTSWKVLVQQLPLRLLPSFSSFCRNRGWTAAESALKVVIIVKTSWMTCPRVCLEFNSLAWNGAGAPPLICGDFQIKFNLC